jgi:hypothetical protein
MTGLAKTVALILGLVVVAAAAGLALGRQENRSGSTDKEIASTATPSRSDQASIPALDAAEPTELETATFALG